jgi:hypothetical protein
MEWLLRLRWWRRRRRSVTGTEGLRFREPFLGLKLFKLDWW